MRQVHYGEGGYEETERLIQELLDAPAQDTVQAGAGNHTQGRTQETYLGYARLHYADNPPLSHDSFADFDGNRTPALHHFSYDGSWDVQEERAVAGERARLFLHFYAADVHLVMAGEGDVTVTLASDPDNPRVVHVDGTSDLYDLYVGEPLDDLMTLEFGEGVEAYAFTFG